MKNVLKLALLGSCLSFDAYSASNNQLYAREVAACMQGCRAKAQQDEPLIQAHECSIVCTPRARVTTKKIQTVPFNNLSNNLKE